MKGIYESDVEEACMEWFSDLDWKTGHGTDFSPGGTNVERESFEDVILIDRLESSLRRINPEVSTEGIEEAIRQIRDDPYPSLIENNKHLHHIITNGISVEYENSTGELIQKLLWVIDFDRPEFNDWLVLNQFTVIGTHERRPDIVCFVNGLPISVIELKNPTDPEATVHSAYSQLKTYKKQISSLFFHNSLLVVSDGIEARVGSLTAEWDRFMPWRVIEDETDFARGNDLELLTLVNGLFEKKRLLKFIRDFVVFHSSGKEINKIIAGYHQFHATIEAVKSTEFAISDRGDGRIGVVWHTQGSGKSLTMVFYSRIISQSDAMSNPTIVVLTDRQDLDQQLFATFSSSSELLRQNPVNVNSRKNLRETLKRDSGGILFTTIQMFMPGKDESKMPNLCSRKNVIVVADEAHRSQYDFIDGFARHMRDALPNAAFIGFTGTPIESQDRNTQAVFGDYVSVYDMRQAQIDGSVVPIHYESRIALVDLDSDVMVTIDEDFENVTADEDEIQKDKLKTRWSALEAVVGESKRLERVVRDILAHFDSRLEIIDGKAMIVCMSRRICVEVYEEIIRTKPEWNSEDDGEGVVKVVMTGNASDPENYQQHIRNKPRREKLANRFRDPDDEFQIVIVRDMWLTGFSASSLHTMYVDKPMKGHGLMQSIARVNRVFRDKPGGLIVDYIGLADNLRKAVLTYTNSGGKGDFILDIGKAEEILVEKHGVIVSMFYGFDWAEYTDGNRTQKLQCLLNGQNHILGLEDGKKRFNAAINELNQAYSLAKTTEEAERLRFDIAFFRDVHGLLNTRSASHQDPSQVESAIKQLVSQAVRPGEIIDIFSAAGLEKPDISILDDEFLAEIQKIPQKNLAAELLEKLLNGEIRERGKINSIQHRLFSEMLQKVMIRYRNRGIDTLQVIDELLHIAKELREAGLRGEELGLRDDELAFYDSLEANDSAVKVLGDEILRTIAREIAETIRKSTTIDWTLREDVQANMRRLVRRILKKHGYPPDKSEEATLTVLKQARLMATSLTS